MAVHMNVSKGRSPRYPRLSLKESISYARRLYDGAHRSAVDSDTAYRVMGFMGKNGASATALGALRQFGLVDGLRGDLRISELALRLLEPSSREEYLEALHEAANKPDAFEALLGHFSQGVPSSDEPIRSYLIRTLHFSKSGADDCIASLRETLSELEAEPIETIVPEGVQMRSPMEMHQDHASRRAEEVASESGKSHGSADLIRIPLTRECFAELRFSGPLTNEAIDRLTRYIALMKDVWADS